jgi:hypothetical protein
MIYHTGMDSVCLLCSDCVKKTNEGLPWAEKMQNATDSNINGFTKVIRNVPQRVSTTYYCNYQDLGRSKELTKHYVTGKESEIGYADWHFFVKENLRVYLVIGTKVSYTEHSEFNGSLRVDKKTPFAKIKVFTGDIKPDNKAVFERTMPQAIAFLGITDIKDFLVSKGFANKKEKEIFDVLFANFA